MKKYKIFAVHSTGIRIELVGWRGRGWVGETTRDVTSALPAGRVGFGFYMICNTYKKICFTLKILIRNDAMALLVSEGG